MRIQGLAPPEHPPCFDTQEQYDNWAEMARLTHHSPSNYCSDCTLEYQSKMIGAGRCNFPDIAPGKEQQKESST